MSKPIEGWALSIFGALFLAVAGLLAYHEIASGSGGLKLFFAVAQGMGSIVIVLTAVTILAVEGFEMLAERYKRKKFEEGKALGQEEERKRWKAWNERREAAAAKGEAFNDPPPGP